jgi:hypothetical protein
MPAERFEKPAADLFDMQDEIVSRLANALNAQLIAAEARRAESTLRPDGTRWSGRPRHRYCNLTSPTHFCQTRR